MLSWLLLSDEDTINQALWSSCYQNKWQIFLPCTRMSNPSPKNFKSLATLAQIGFKSAQVTASFISENASIHAIDQLSFPPSSFKWFLNIYPTFHFFNQYFYINVFFFFSEKPTTSYTSFHNIHWCPPSSTFTPWRSDQCLCSKSLRSFHSLPLFFIPTSYPLSTDESSFFGNLMGPDSHLLLL